MIHHCVFLDFTDDFGEVERRALLAAFLPLVDEIDGLVRFESGPNVDFESK